MVRSSLILWVYTMTESKSAGRIYAVITKSGKERISMRSNVLKP